MKFLYESIDLRVGFRGSGVLGSKVLGSGFRGSGFKGSGVRRIMSFKFSNIGLNGSDFSEL